MIHSSEALANRGPDDEGFYGGNTPCRRDSLQDATEWGLIHRRLSIIDLSEAGWQPMQDIESGITIALNGEIYNYQEIATELKRSGVTFKSTSDTEVVLKAWKEWGPHCVQKFQGMFALAVLNERESKLWLCRDAIGIKPLFIIENAQGLFFGSNIPSLLALIGERPPINQEMAWTFLIYGTTTAGKDSYYQGIEKLTPGTILEISTRDISQKRVIQFWKPSTQPIDPDLTVEQAAKKLRELYLRSTELHLRSDTPVALSLSGGIDSTALAGLVHEVKPGAIQVAYTFQAEDKAIDELPLATMVAKQRGLDLRVVQFHEQDFTQLALDCVKAHSEPFPGTSILASHAVFQQCHNDGFKVLINGQGPDEIFAGYSWFRKLRVATLLKQKRFAKAFQLNTNFGKWPDSRRPISSGWSVQLLTPKCLERLVEIALQKKITRVASQLHLEEILTLNSTSLKLPLSNTCGEFISNHVIQKGLQNILIWCDQSSMRWSVEARVPFILPEIADFARTLPDEFLVNDQGMCKFVHREAVKDLLPKEVLDVRRKIGFETDEAKFLKNCPELIQLATEHLHNLETIGVSPDKVKQLIHNWQTGKQPYHPIIFRALSLSLWSNN
jgi:asparagine synthase (glutamine-hydrolysing)